MLAIAVVVPDRQGVSCNPAESNSRKEIDHEAKHHAKSGMNHKAQKWTYFAVQTTEDDMMSQNAQVNWLGRGRMGRDHPSTHGKILSGDV